LHKKISFRFWCTLTSFYDNSVATWRHCKNDPSEKLWAILTLWPWYHLP
jgi:hypothetical protein